MNYDHEELPPVPAVPLAPPIPYTVSIPDDKIEELHLLIALGKVAPLTYEGSLQDRRYGITNEWLQQAKEQWLQFDWRETENEINSFSNYHVHILKSGHKHLIHYIAMYSANTTAVPLLLLHGWPGSFLEFLPLLRLIKSKYIPHALPYDIIVPSLPGYGFSTSPPTDRDFRLEDAADILDCLMCYLGYRKGYVVHGGDVGSYVARVLGGTCPRAKAIHLNSCIMPNPLQPLRAGELSPYSELEKRGLIRENKFQRLGSAYALEHATKPSTIGLMISSSPLALLAWMGEKFLDWTDEPLPMKAILEQVSLYWFAECSAISLWPFRQLFTPGAIGAHENPAWFISKPFGMSWFPKEMAPVPKSWVQTTGLLVWWKEHDCGGHFVTLEMPEDLLDDLEEFITHIKVLIW